MDKEFEKYNCYSIESQIDNLKRLGLRIDDEEFAKSQLSQISYYRLVKAYGFFFRDGNKYKENTSFDNLISLYKFDYELRSILLPFLETIEIRIRCLVCYTFLSNHGEMDYLEKESFSDNAYFNKWLSEATSIKDRCETSPIVSHYNSKHNGNIPFYAFIELMSFGNLTHFYKNMKTEERKLIAKSLGVKQYYLGSWLDNLSTLRNACAHYERIYGKENLKPPALYKDDEKSVTNRRSLYASLLCMRHLLDDTNFSVLRKSIFDLFEYNKNLIDISKLGFNKDWNYYFQGIDPESPHVRKLEELKKKFFIMT